MNSLDKLKRYKKWRSLYGYSAILSIFLLSSIFKDSLTVSDLLSFFFLLPLPFYFALRTIKAHQKLKSLNALRQKSLYNIRYTQFSLSSFLTQPSLSFRLSLILLLLTIWTGMARSYADHKNLQAKSQILDSQYTLSDTN